MTTEPTQPQEDMGPSPAATTTDQGHRRRRRRRKNKSGHTAPIQAQGQPAQPAAPAPARPQSPPPSQAQNQPQGQGHAQGDAGRRGKKKKKKFPQNGPGSRPRPEPGNSIFGQQQGKRKNKQRGPREFVGPMDHSYRVANGNIADGPASTTQIANGNGNGNYYADNYEAKQPAAPVREDAPTRIFCFIEDLFFLAKIQETARKLGVKVEFVKGDKEAVAKLTGVAETDRPRLLVFDLNNANAKPLTLIPKLKTKFKKATLDHRFPLTPAGRPEGEGSRSRMRHCDAALGFLAEPAQPASPLWHGRGRTVRAAAGVVDALFCACKGRLRVAFAYIQFPDFRYRKHSR